MNAGISDYYINLLPDLETEDAAKKAQAVFQQTQTDLKQAQKAFEEAQKNAKEEVDRFTKEAGKKPLNADLSKISNPQAREALQVIQTLNDSNNAEVNALKKALEELAKDPNNIDLKTASQEALNELKNTLNLSENSLIAQSLKDPQKALEFIKQASKNPYNLIEQEIKSAATNGLKKELAKLELKMAAMGGHLGKSNFHSLPLFLRKIPLISSLPWIGSWLQPKMPDGEDIITNAKYWNSSLEAGENLKKNLSWETIKNNGYKPAWEAIKTNWKNGREPAWEAIKSTFKPAFKFGKDLLKLALERNIKGLAKKLTIPLAVAGTVTGLVKTSGPIGDLARTLVNFSFTDGTAEALANGDMGGFALKMFKWAGLTAAAIGITAIAAPFAPLVFGSLATIPMAGAIGSTALFTGLSWGWDRTENAIAGLTGHGNNQTTQVASNGGSPAPFTKEQLNSLPDSLKDDGEAYLNSRKNIEFSV